MAAVAVVEVESAIAGKDHEYRFMGGCHRKVAAPSLFVRS